MKQHSITGIYTVNKWEVSYDKDTLTVYVDITCLQNIKVLMTCKEMYYLSLCSILTKGKNIDEIVE